jgi:hypothetical protein
MKNIADVTRGKPIVLLQSTSGVSAINPLVAFYDIHGGKREVLLFYFVPDTTRDRNLDDEPRLRILFHFCTRLFHAYIKYSPRRKQIFKNALCLINRE